MGSITTVVGDETEGTMEISLDSFETSREFYTHMNQLLLTEQEKKYILCSKKDSKLLCHALAMSDTYYLPDSKYDIHLFTGPMGAGKTTKLIEAFCKHRGKTIYTPSCMKAQNLNRKDSYVSDACEHDICVARSGNYARCTYVESLLEICEQATESVVFIDELMFFDSHHYDYFLDWCETHGKTVYGSLLNKNYKGELFSEFAGKIFSNCKELLAMHALCSFVGCNEKAYDTLAVNESNSKYYPESFEKETEVVDDGRSRYYYPACRSCFNKYAGKSQKTIDKSQLE